MATYIINRNDEFLKTVKSYSGAIQALKNVASEVGHKDCEIQTKNGEAFFEYNGDRYSTKTFSF